MQAQSALALASGGDAVSPGEREEDLVRRLQSYDEAAFEDLVRTNYRLLLFAARRILGNDEDAEDAVQEAFLLAYRSLHSFRGQSRLSTWLYRILTNTALMQLRRRKRRREVSRDELPPNSFAEPQAPPVEEELERRDLLESIRRTIPELPESYRSVLVMRELCEHTTKSTARMLGLTENAVKIRLHRARKALQERVAAAAS